MRDDDRADEIFGDCRERIERRETVDPEEVIRAHPDLAATLRERFAALAMVNQMLSPRRGDGHLVPSLAGRALGPYRLVSALGSGGMGSVWLATVEGPAGPLAAGTRVAVKVLHPHLGVRADSLKRFLREAELGQRVRHAAVVRTLDAAAIAIDGVDRHILVMEYVEGRTLRALLDDEGRLPEELCRHVGREVAMALGAIHDAGAVHRDLKPENVLITKDHVVKVMDLGVARLRDEVARLSQAGAFVGSLVYGAPEQFRRNGAIDGRADLHALGLLLYELATGTHPFTDADTRIVVRRILDERPRPCGEVVPQLSPLFEDLVAQLLEKDVARRPSSAADVARILEEGEESVWWRERASAIREATRRPLRRIRIPRETALYGRDAELARLRVLYEKAKAGDGQVVLVEGEAGIGKSRLVDEFVGLLAQAGEDVNFLYGSYPPGGAATASGAFSTAYREHLGDDEPAIRAALPQTPLLVPAFAALLRGDVAPPGSEPLTRDSLKTVFVHATRTFAAQRTTIVLIDDLHFAPEEGRALFASLALALPGHRILLVGCARPGLDEKWITQVDRLDHATRLPLPRLGPKELVRLLRDALKSERLAEELGVLIAVKSDGNPFFVFELLRGLRDGQFLRQRPDGTWETTQVIRDIQVPSSIAELVQARVADLDAEDKNLLDVAACCGFEFDPLVVAAALGIAQIPAMQRLARIEKKHRLVRSAGRRFVFDHHQVQEALYAGMPELLREPYHAAIAEAIEARSGAASKEPKDVEGAVCVEIAEHFLEGAKGERALRYLDAALTHLERSYLNGAAVRLADRALAVPGLLAGKERVEVLLRKAARLDLLGRREGQRAALDEAISYADPTGDDALRGRVGTARGWYFVQVSRFAEAETSLRTALELARRTGDGRNEGSSLHVLAGVFHRLGRHAEAREHSERCIALAREIGDPRLESRANTNLANVLESLGRHAEAREHFERILARARQCKERQAEAIATGNLGSVLCSLGRYAEAREIDERCLVLAREIGDRQLEALAAGNLGLVLASLGRYAEAREPFEGCRALAQEIGDRIQRARALCNIGSLHLALGNVALARGHLEQSLSLCREIGARDVAGYALARLATAADAQGEGADAMRLFGESLALRREIADCAVAESLVEISDLRRRAGDAEGARAPVEEALRLVQEHRYVAATALCLALLANLGGDARVAHAALAESGEGSEWARAHFLLWQATRDRAHLAEAKRLLDHLVAHAPPECRESMLANVRLHREIAAAAREHGIA